MLVLSRRVGEVLILRPRDEAVAALTIGELFADGPIVISVSAVRGSRVKIAIEAPAALKVLRGELVG